MGTLKEFGRLVVAAIGVVALLAFVLEGPLFVWHIKHGQPVTIDIVFMIATVLILTISVLLIWKK